MYTYQLLSWREVDKFKKGYEQINFNARAFTRTLNEIIGGAEADSSAKDNGVKIEENGVLINADGGKVFILTSGQHHSKVSEVSLRKI